MVVSFIGGNGYREVVLRKMGSQPIPNMVQWNSWAITQALVSLDLEDQLPQSNQGNLGQFKREWITSTSRAPADPYDARESFSSYGPLE